ncbi:MAG: hypothetical protein ABI156_13410, partial [Caldimonas sp.]
LAAAGSTLYIGLTPRTLRCRRIENCREDRMDAVYLGLAAIFYALLYGLVEVCAKLRSRP